MTAGANRVFKSDPLVVPSVHVPGEASIKASTHSPRIDSNAVILIITVRTSDNNIGGAPDVEAVGVLALARSSRVVNGHASNGKAVRIVNADSLDGRVLDVQVGDGRVGEVMGVEELGFRHAAGASLAIPVLGPASIEDGPGRTLDGYGLALDLQERPGPLFIAPGCCALENNLSWSV